MHPRSVAPPVISERHPASFGVGPGGEHVLALAGGAAGPAGGAAGPPGAPRAGGAGPAGRHRVRAVRLRRRAVVLSF